MAYEPLDLSVTMPKVPAEQGAWTLAELVPALAAEARREHRCRSRRLDVIVDNPVGGWGHRLGFLPGLLAANDVVRLPRAVYLAVLMVVTGSLTYGYPAWSGTDAAAFWSFVQVRREQI